MDSKRKMNRLVDGLFACWVCLRVGGSRVQQRGLAFAISMAICSLVAGCLPPPGLEVQEIRYPGFERRAVDGACENFEVFEADQILPEGCQQIGDIFIGDTGLTDYWQPEDLIDELERFACGKGTAKVQIIRINPPRGGSPCHQLRAALVACY